MSSVRGWRKITIDRSTGYLNPCGDYDPTVVYSWDNTKRDTVRYNNRWWAVKSFGQAFSNIKPAEGSAYWADSNSTNFFYKDCIQAENIAAGSVTGDKLSVGAKDQLTLEILEDVQNTVQVGGSNYALHTSNSWTNAESANGEFFRYDAYVPSDEIGAYYSLAFDIKWSKLEIGGLNGYEIPDDYDTNVTAPRISIISLLDGQANKPGPYLDVLPELKYAELSNGKAFVANSGFKTVKHVYQIEELNAKGKKFTIYFKVENFNNEFRMSLCNFRLQRGNQPSAWQPAPEDTEIGGRNYILNSMSQPMVNYWKKAGTSNSGVSFDNSGLVFGVNNNWALHYVETGLLNEYITVTFDAKIKSESTVGILEYAKVATDINTGDFYNSGMNGKPIVLSGEFKRFSETIKSGSDKFGIFLKLSSTAASNNASIVVKNLKVEKGTRATDWSPAPEDAENAIKQAEELANQAQQDANNAQSGANAANNMLSDISSDNKVTEDEKKQLRIEYDSIKLEYPKNVDSAKKFSLPYTNYKNAYDDLVSYAGPIIESKGTTDITGRRVEFTGKFTNYYSERESLLNAIYIYCNEKAQAAANSAQEVKDDLGTYKSDTSSAIKGLETSIGEIKDQIDGNVQMFNGDYIPTLLNDPAVQWTTDIEREKHIGDIFNSTIESNGEINIYTYKFAKHKGTYIWAQVTDSQAAEALQQAQEALGIANSKVRCFMGTTPSVPYDKNDLWIYMSGNSSENGTLRICTSSRATGSYVASDWLLADDSMVRLSNMANDNIITKEEKVSLRKSYSETTAEYARYIADCGTYGVTYTDYKSAYDALMSAYAMVGYSNSLDYTFKTGEKEIYTQAFINYSTEKIKLANKLADKISQINIDNVEVGGVNLLDGSGRFSGIGKFEAYRGTVSLSDGKYIRFTSTNAGDGYIVFLQNINTIVSSGEYILSAKVRANKSSRKAFGPSNDFPAQIYTISTNWSVVTCNITVNAPGQNNCFPGVYRTLPNIDAFEVGDWIEIEWIQLEKGNKNTDWTPSNKDVNDAIDAAKKAADDAEANAQSSIAAINNMASDIVISRAEKATFRDKWKEIVSEYSIYTGYSTNPGVSTSAYISAYNNVSSALTSIAVASDTDFKFQNTTQKDSFVNTFSVYYNERTKLLNAVANKLAEDRVSEVEIGATNIASNLTANYESGAYSNSSGDKIDTTDYLRCKNKIPVYPSSKYIYTINSSYSIDIHERTSDGSFLGKVNVINGKFSTKSNTRYLTINVHNTNYGTISLSAINNIKLMLEAGNKSTSYSPSPDDVAQGIDNIQVGVRNLLDYSGNFLLSDKVFTGGGGCVIEYNKPYFRMSIPASFEPWAYMKFNQSVKNILSPGEYVLSARIRANRACKKYFDVSSDDGTYTLAQSGISLTQAFQVYIIKFKVTEGWTPRDAFIRVSIAYDSDPWVSEDWIEFDWLQLETGNKATDWTPSPNDIENRLLKTGIDITDGQIKATADQFRVQNNAGIPIAVFDGSGPIPMLRAQNIQTDNLTVKNLRTRSQDETGKYIEIDKESHAMSMYDDEEVLRLLISGDKYDSLSKFVDTGATSTSPIITTPFRIMSFSETASNINSFWRISQKSSKTIATFTIPQGMTGEISAIKYYLQIFGANSTNTSMSAMIDLSSDLYIVNTTTGQEGKIGSATDLISGDFLASKVTVMLQKRLITVPGNYRIEFRGSVSGEISLYGDGSDPRAISGTVYFDVETAAQDSPIVKIFKLSESTEIFANGFGSKYSNLKYALFANIANGDNTLLQNVAGIASIRDNNYGLFVSSFGVHVMDDGNMAQKKKLDTSRWLRGSFPATGTNVSATKQTGDGLSVFGYMSRTAIGQYRIDIPGFTLAKGYSCFVQPITNVERFAMVVKSDNVINIVIKNSSGSNQDCEFDVEVRSY